MQTPAGVKADCPFRRLLTDALPRETVIQPATPKVRAPDYRVLISI